MNTIEKRRFADPIEYRRSGRTTTLTGYGAVFNRLSEDLGGFREVISEEAFNDLDQSDVRALFNHDPNHILGRTTAGTLRLFIDDHGLRYELDLPDTTLGRDLSESVKRGDISESSFAFRVLEDSWETRDGMQIRTIKKVAELIDVSPVTYPAYKDASVSARAAGLRAKANTVEVARVRLLDLIG